MAYYPAPIACPQCGLSDHVQKVSAIFHQGASTSMFTGHASGLIVPFGDADMSSTLHTVRLAGGQQTLLSQRLSPPARPIERSPWNGWIVAGLLLLSMCSLAQLCILGADVVRQAETVVGSGIGLALFLLGVGALVAVVLRNRSRNRVTWEQQLAAWQVSMARWDALYYCGRDDLVFVPGTSLHVPAGAMFTLL